MKQGIRHLLLSAAIPGFILFVMYMLKALEVTMGWDFTHLGIYPLNTRGLFGICAHPLVHRSWAHLFANSLPFLLLSWCLFYFYRAIAPTILFIIWIGCGVLTFFIGAPGWHVGSSGLIYGLAFFIFFSGIIRRYAPLIAISLLITFLYGGLVWNMLPQFALQGTSWEGHLSGAIVGTLCAFAFIHKGPQKPSIEAEPSTSVFERKIYIKRKRIKPRRVQRTN